MRGEEGGGEVQREGGVGVEVVPLDQVAHGTDENGLDAALRVGDIQMRASWRSLLLAGMGNAGAAAAPPPACPYIAPGRANCTRRRGGIQLAFWGAWTTPGGRYLPRGLIGSQGAALSVPRAPSPNRTWAPHSEPNMFCVVAHAAHFVAGAVQRDRLAAARCEQELVLQVGCRAPAAWSPGPSAPQVLSSRRCSGLSSAPPSRVRRAPRSARTAGILLAARVGGSLSVPYLYWLWWGRCRVRRARSPCRPGVAARWSGTGRKRDWRSRSAAPARRGAAGRRRCSARRSVAPAARRRNGRPARCRPARAGAGGRPGCAAGHPEPGTS